MNDDDRPGPHPLAPWPTLAERDVGTELEPELYEGVPPHLLNDLVDWVNRTIQGQDPLVRTVLNRFRVSWSLEVRQGVRASPAHVLRSIVRGQQHGIKSPRPLDALSVLNALIALHPDWDNHESPGYGDETYAHHWMTTLVDLHNLLTDTGSAWTVDGELRGLYRRVDPTATEAWRQARKLADSEGRSSAAANLKAAWREIYGQSPAPSASYSAAVKAVEAVVVPVIAPGSGCTVHAAARKLRNNPTDWQFALIHEPGSPAGAGSIDVVSAMLDRLLLGETDRHTSDIRNRASTQEEAETAVHLAVTLVQWFSSGAIQPRSTS